MLRRKIQTVFSFADEPESGLALCFAAYSCPKGINAFRGYALVHDLKNGEALEVRAADIEGLALVGPLVGIAE